MNKLKTVLMILAIIILLLILSGLICFKLAMTDDNTDKYNTSPSIEPAQTIAINAALGTQSDISEEELNEMISYFIYQANEKDLFNESCKLNAFYLDLNSGTPCKCYFQVNYKGRELGFSADVDIQMKPSAGTISLSFSNAAVGRLHISKSLLIKTLDNTNVSNISDYISVEDLSVNVPNHFNIELPVIGDAITVDIEDLKVSEDNIHIETNPIIGDTLDNIKGKLGNKIFDFAKDHLPESWGDYLDKLQ